MSGVTTKTNEYSPSFGPKPPLYRRAPMITITSVLAANTRREARSTAIRYMRYMDA
jgi:hypothetical protein